MECWTIQFGQRYKLAKELPRVVLLDTTVKSGSAVFAPTWHMVIGYKQGRLTDEKYIEHYTQLMRSSYDKNREEWLRVCHLSHVALGCYCPSDHFCHRFLLKDLLLAVCQHHGLPFTYRGEYKKEK